MATTVRESRVVRRPVDVVATVATDPARLLPTIAGLGRFAFIRRADDGSEEWDMFLDVGAVHLGGRVRVVPRGHSLTWESIRGTRHAMLVTVQEHPAGSLLTLQMTIDLAGALFGRAAELLARGIARNHLVAGLEQLRHHVEFELG